MPTELLPARTEMAGVALDVADLDAMRRFYSETLLLDVQDERGDKVVLGQGGQPLVTLRHNPSLPRATRRTAGLFHTALLHPDQASLAATMASLAADAPQLFTGSADHAVSEAFYLDDPEGNGVELYVDRPRDQWTWRSGRVHMVTEPLDPNAFIAEHLTDSARNIIATRADNRPGWLGDSGTVVGHVHLRVGNTAQAKDFYVDSLGFEVTAELPGALFIAAGGYHHHMAMNTWGSAGVGLRAPALGLGRVDITLPDADDLAQAAARLRSRGWDVRDDGPAVEVDDPWGNLVRLLA